MVSSYFEREKARLDSRYAETEIELEILEAAFEEIKKADIGPEEMENLSRYIAGIQERDRRRLNILTERKTTVTRILEVISLTAV